MYATAKEMFFPFFSNESKAAAKKPVAKATAKDERSALIDKMVETWGVDRDVRRRYFEVSQTV